MLPLSSTISNQIRFLLHSVTNSNSDSIHRELCQFVEYGREASTLLLQTCLDQLSSNDGDVKNSQLKRDLVSAVFKFLLDRPNFCTIFCESSRGPLMSDGFLGDLSKTLNLSTAEKIGVGLALSESENLDFRARGHTFFIAQIEDLTTNPNLVVSNEQIQDIILFLCRSEGLSKHVDSFTKILLLIPRNQSSFFVQAPILTDDISSMNSLRQLDLFYEGSNNDFEAVLAEIEQEMSMADILRELGYGCTISTSHCKEMLSLFLPLNEVMLSKLLGTIARTRVGLDDAQNIHLSFCSALGISLTFDPSLLSSWNVDVLVDSIRQLAPKTNWICVMENLDHEGFNIPDETSFSLLMSVYNKACQDPFPLHAICGSVWKNAEGQLSFLKYAVSASPDVFTFAHCSRQLTYADSHDLSKGVGNQAWSCLDLLDVLSQLAERGHASSVRLILEHPLSQCPDILLVGIAQINSTYNLLQFELSSNVFPMMLNDPVKSSVIHNLWRVNPNLVLRGFVDAHRDPGSLFRILGICQEMKILSLVLDSTPFPVSIRLAAVAYSKEHVYLEKWLNENLNIYKDTFSEDCLAFLKEVFFDVANDVPHNSLQQSGAAVLNAYHEACPIFSKVLQANSGQGISQQFIEELKRLYTLSTPTNQSPVVTDSSMLTAEGSSDDIEAEANAYFHQMFSEQLTIDAMVQMLARFKESSEKSDEDIMPPPRSRFDRVYFRRRRAGLLWL